MDFLAISCDERARNSVKSHFICKIFKGRIIAEMFSVLSAANLNSFFISLPFFAQQKREIAKSAYLRERELRRPIS